MNDSYYHQRKKAHLCVNCGRPTEMRPKKGFYTKCEICRAKERIKKREQLGIEIKEDDPETLCWTCKHAVPRMVDCKYEQGCSWSINLEPVPGWAAEPQLKATANNESYFVKACPQYERG